MAKWEYSTVEVGHWGDLEVQLDELGREGWEAIAVVPMLGCGGLRVLLKRPLVEGE